MISFNQISQNQVLLAIVTVFVIIPFSDHKANFVQMMLFYEVFQSQFIHLILVNLLIAGHKLFMIAIYLSLRWQYFFTQLSFRRNHDVVMMVMVSCSSWISSFFMISCRWIHRSPVRILIVVVVVKVVIVNIVIILVIAIIIVKGVGFTAGTATLS